MIEINRTDQDYLRQKVALLGKVNFEEIIKDLVLIMDKPSTTDQPITIADPTNKPTEEPT